MTMTEFQMQALRDPRLALQATSAHPVWLWSADGLHVLWANPAAARLFGAANSAELAGKNFGPADPHRRQVAQLAKRLPASGATRLERLRGFGARPGMLMTCACARLAFPDGRDAILVTALDTAMRGMPLAERLQLLVEGQTLPMASFDGDGRLMGASKAAGSLLTLLSGAETRQAYADALMRGHAELPIPGGSVVVQRIGGGAEVGLVALVMPHIPDKSPVHESHRDLTADTVSAHVVAPAAERPLPGYEQPALTNEAPSEFALIDEFAEPLENDGEAPSAEPPAAQPDPIEAELIDNSKALEDTAPAPRRHPLRFTWHMDADGYFSLGSDEFTSLIGTRTAAGFGRPWREIAERFGLDPDDRLREAVASRQTWNGITLYWPVDGGGRLPVELSGVPVFDEGRAFTGYRGFGVCRDLDSLAHLAELRRLEEVNADAEPAAHPLGADTAAAESEHAAAARSPTARDVRDSEPPRPSISIADDISAPAALAAPMERAQNVVPFRPIGEPKSPALSPVENNAFNELARQLSERLDNDASAERPGEAPAADLPREQASAPEWLVAPEPPARGEARRDRTLLDLLPSGILIYRLDRLLYANPAFLQRVGYDSLHALEQAGGLDALYVEAGVSQASSTSEAGMPMKISASEDQPATDARLFTISWDEESALALMFAPADGALEGPSGESAAAAPASVPATGAPAVGEADAEDLAAILDTTAEGIVMFDAAGNIQAGNRSAEALFGYDGEDLLRHAFADLFAPESQRAVAEYLEAVKGAGVASLLDHGREVLGRVAKGGIIPLSMTMGRTRPDGPNYFAVFRDQSQGRKGESEIQQARHLADRTASAKADMLARISHELRTPLNTIIGFAEVMIGERFGALGSERYVEYMKDIRASGERATAIINDLTELSRIETGKLDLTFTSQNLNELVESCVAMMQPQANRARIIIRTSLAPSLPPVMADARALRQITLNLIGNSIHLASAAGQVIVSTAMSDFGEVILRVRDTGPGLNDNEVAAALEPFRTPPPSDQSSAAAPVSLSLTKALVEANRAQFNLKSAAHSGTLVEIVFARAMARN
jgi:PAS domain S-box-containing protein